LGESRYDAEWLSLFDPPLLQTVIDLIHELIGGTDSLTVKRERIVRFSPVTEEIVSSANLLGDKHMKASLEFPPILNLICFALCH
jgi:hypothetical protein